MTKSNIRVLLNELGVYNPITATKKQLEALLDESFRTILNSTVPVGTTLKHLESYIREYFEAAAVIATDKGLCFRKTEKHTQFYNVDFTISGILNIRADSEESATKWLENELDGFNYSSSVFTIEDSCTHICDVYRADYVSTVQR